MKGAVMRLSFLIVLTCCLAVLAKSWSYNYNNTTKTITITGNGAMDNYTSERSMPWLSVKGEIEHVIIEFGITHIGDLAFHSCTRLLSVEVPESVTHIGYCAFAYCYDLSIFSLPDSLKSIDQMAFRACKNLNPMRIHSNITYIGDGAFGGCQRIESFDVDLNNPNYQSGDGLLLTKTGNELITFPAGRKGSYTLPNTITAVHFGAFERCLLSSVTILGNLSSLPIACFFSSSDLESIILPDSIISFSGYAFSGCTSLKSIILPASLTKLADNVFAGCFNLSFVSYYGTSSNITCANDNNPFSDCAADAICVPFDSNISSFCGTTDFCKSSSCESIHQQLNNKCFDVICENNEWSIIKNATAIEWEKKTNGCVDYQCSNESGLVMKSKCDGEDTVCIDGECKSTKTTEKGWSVVIDFDESLTLITEVNVSEIRDTLKVLCGLEFGDDIEVGIEYNSAGQVSSLIILVDDEKVAQTISSKVEEASQSTTCDIGVLCENKGIRVKELVMYDLSSMEIEGCSRHSDIVFLIHLLMITVIWR